MLVVVESVLLDAAVDAQADGAAQHVEEDQAAEYGPRGIYHGAEQLYAEHVQAAAVEQAAVEGEDAREDRSERAADAVNGYCADGVVDLGHAVEEADGEDHCGAADDAYECRAGGADGVTACGDADKARKHAVKRERERRLAVAHPRHDKCREGSRCGRDVGIHEYGRGALLQFGCRDADGAARVESEPSDPEDEDAERGDRQVVAEYGVGLAVLVLADTGPYHRRANQCEPSARRVYDGRAGEVVESQRREPSAAPCPVARYGVDEGRDEDTVYEVCAELRTLGHGARDDRGGCGAEHGLEDEECRLRDVRGHGRTEREGVGYESGKGVGAEHYAEAEEPEEQRAETEVEQVLHEDVGRVLRAGESGLDRCESHLHHEYQDCREQYPYGVDTRYEVVEACHYVKIVLHILTLFLT